MTDGPPDKRSSEQRSSESHSPEKSSAEKRSAEKRSAKQRPSINQMMRWLKRQRAQKGDASLADLICGLSVPTEQLIDLACIDLMQRRRAGQSARVEDYTRQFPKLAEERLLLDLIDAEICVANELKQPLNRNEYSDRFPSVADAIGQLFDLPEHHSGSLSWNRSANTPSDGADVAEPKLPDRLGGYRILRLLGRGAMGAVYEAKQVSLDRLVAIKTIRDRIVQHPITFARFTREAYSAAQLAHHNIVQVYDFGEDHGRYFFSMERVGGGSIADVIRRKGALDPRMAAGYALQAARGLEYVHRHGMVHRDIKPANLLLNEEGVVKVADLGLVKLPGQTSEIDEMEGPVAVASGRESGSQVTMQGTAVGTPAYMAPEQGLNAAGVDHRADIYSLGCTLFYMLTGRPPFQGTDVSDVVRQHVSVDPPDLCELNSRVPRALQQIVSRAMAKRPQDRYASAAEMIQQLESFLGIRSTSHFTPSSDQADQWEEITKRFAACAPRRRVIRWTFPLLLLIGLVLLLTTGWLIPSWWLLAPSLVIFASMTAWLADARKGGHPVVAATRRWMLSLTWIDFALGFAITVVALLLLIVTGWWIGMAVGAGLGVALGWAFHLCLVSPAQRSESKPVADAERFIRNLRIDGADEEGIREMVARYSGDGWQRLFESLFGYQALMAMRNRLRRESPSHDASLWPSLLDAICARLDAKTEANRQRRDQEQLFKIEQRGLQQQGYGSSEAREQAWQLASAVIREARASSVDQREAAAAVQAKRDRMKAMLADARSGKYRQTKSPRSPLKSALSGQTRLIAGLILTAMFVIWGNQHGVFEPLQRLDTLNELTSGRVDLQEVTSALRETAAAAEPAEESEPSTLLGASPWSVGIAGLLLMMSAFVSGWRITPPALIATVVILYGPSLGIPPLATLPSWMVAAIAGVVIYLPGVIWGESGEE